MVTKVLFWLSLAAFGVVISWVSKIQNEWSQLATSEQIAISLIVTILFIAFFVCGVRFQRLTAQNTNA